MCNPDRIKNLNVNRVVEVSLDIPAIFKAIEKAKQDRINNIISEHNKSDEYEKVTLGKEYEKVLDLSIDYIVYSAIGKLVSWGMASDHEFDRLLITSLNTTGICAMYSRGDKRFFTLVAVFDKDRLEYTFNS